MLFRSFISGTFVSINGKFTLSSASTDSEVSTVPTSTQLFQFSNSASYVSTEAYVSTKGSYFDASEVVIGDLTKFNTSQFGTGVSTSAVVSKLFGNYVGASPTTYFNGQQIVFGDGENFFPSQLKTSGLTSFYQYIPSGITASGNITLSSPTASTDAEVSITPTSTQLFQFSGSYTNLKATEAYIGAGLSAPA